MSTMPRQNPQHIASVTLDETRAGTGRFADLEHERHKAVADLLAANSFELLDPAATGPYAVTLRLSDGRFCIGVACRSSGVTADIRLPLSGFRRLIHDYTILCDNFYKTAREGQYHRLEAIDAGRRSIHDEAAEMLAETAEDRIKIDKMTARRLFSLLYVLDMRGTDFVL